MTRTLKRRGWHGRHEERDAVAREDETTRAPASAEPENEGRDAGERGDEREAAAGRRDEREAVSAGPDEQVERRAPDSPTDLPRHSWTAVLKGTLKEFKRDELSDRAAALTYYSILALFPALLALVSLLGIVGRSATQTVLDNIQKLAPGPGGGG
ncbi:YhjD/YihY/BrkB family envelope integrity protein, partial [Streptomyces hayashii]